MPRHPSEGLGQFARFGKVTPLSQKGRPGRDKRSISGTSKGAIEGFAGIVEFSAARAAGRCVRRLVDAFDDEAIDAAVWTCDEPVPWPGWRGDRYGQKMGRLSWGALPPQEARDRRS